MNNAINNGYGGLPDWKHGYGFLTMPPLDGNNPPVAVDDSYSTVKNTTLNVSAPGVLANDSDPDGDPLSAALGGSNTSNGTLTFFADGAFIYQPDLNFTGTDSFTYTANDGTADSNEATVTITIDAANMMHVASIDLSIRTKGRRSEAVAAVKIMDENGNPVSGAQVFGTFSGEQIVGGPVSTSATTNKKGIANLKLKLQGLITSFNFCVDDVTHSSYVYNPADNNVESCVSY